MTPDIKNDDGNFIESSPSIPPANEAVCCMDMLLFLLLLLLLLLRMELVLLLLGIDSKSFKCCVSDILVVVVIEFAVEVVAELNKVAIAVDSCCSDMDGTGSLVVSVVELLVL